jgi:primosomal protein N'
MSDPPDKPSAECRYCRAPSDSPVCPDCQRERELVAREEKTEWRQR